MFESLPRPLVSMFRLSLIAQLLALTAFMLAAATPAATAHQSGCHAAHSCPSDTGSYVCGDTGNYTYCGGGTGTPTTDPSGTGQPVAAPPVPVPPAPGDPSTDKDCANFSSQAEAQSYFALKGGPVSDSDRLDADGDGIACEALGGAAEAAPTGAACEVRTGTGLDPADTPASPYDITRADVQFERCIGRLTLALTFNAPLPPPPFPGFDYLVWWLGEQQSCDLPSSATVYANISFLNGATFNVKPGTEYPKIFPTVTADRRGIVLSFVSPALVGRDLRCAMPTSSSSGAGALAGYDSVKAFYFNGFDPDAAKRSAATTVKQAAGRAPTLTATAARGYARAALKRRFKSSYRSAAKVTCAQVSRTKRDCVVRWSIPRRARYSGRVTIWTVNRDDEAEWHYSLNVGRRDLRCKGSSDRCLRRIVAR